MPSLASDDNFSFLLFVSVVVVVERRKGRAANIASGFSLSLCLYVVAAYNDYLNIDVKQKENKHWNQNKK